MGHDSLREASELLRQERRSGQRSEHRCSHRLLNAPQNIISTAVSNTTILYYRKHYIPLLLCTYRQKNYRTASTTLLRACSCALSLGGRSSLSYLSCDLCGGDGSSHGGGSGQSTRRCWCEKGHGWRHGFAHAQVLTTQVEQVHGGDGVLGRLSLLILCTQEMSRPPSEVPPTSHRAPP